MIYAELPYYRQAVQQRRAYVQSLAELAQQKQQARAAEALQQEQLDASRKQSLISSGISGLGTLASAAKTAYDLGLIGGGGGGSLSALFGGVTTEGLSAGASGMLPASLAEATLAAPAATGGALAAGAAPAATEGLSAGASGMLPASLAEATLAAPAATGGALAAGAAAAPSVAAGGAASGLGAGGGALAGGSFSGYGAGAGSTVFGSGAGGGASVGSVLGPVGAAFAVALAGKWLQDKLGIGVGRPKRWPGAYDWIQGLKRGEHWDVDKQQWIKGAVDRNTFEGLMLLQGNWGPGLYGDERAAKIKWAAQSLGFDPDTYEYTGVIPEDIGEDPVKGWESWDVQAG